MGLFDLFRKNQKIKNINVTIKKEDKKLLQQYRNGDFYNKNTPKPLKARIGHSESVFARTKAVALKSLGEFKDSNIKKYSVSTCNDERVCDLCKKHEKKVYLVSKAEIGINAPPFCDKCRCVIIPEFKGIIEKGNVKNK